MFNLQDVLVGLVVPYQVARLPGWNAVEVTLNSLSILKLVDLSQFACAPEQRKRKTHRGSRAVGDGRCEFMHNTGKDWGSYQTSLEILSHNHDDVRSIMGRRMDVNAPGLRPISGQRVVMHCPYFHDAMLERSSSKRGRIPGC